ncbi:MAG: hypothetical protein Q8O01_03900 [Candidatus Omnitrophota bacterium]|nr:hypothetical protein [Candidatus Omnitrophota bacterium]
MTEAVMEKQLTENAARLAEEWYRGDFEIDYYNYRICTTAEGLIQMCKEDRGVEVTLSEIEDMCKPDLLEFIVNDEDGKKMFPQFMADRVAFLKRLQTKFKYPIPQLQQIIAYENELVPYSNEECDFYYTDRRNIYRWAVKRAGTAADGIKDYLQGLKILANRYGNDVKKQKHKGFTEKMIKILEEDLTDRKRLMTYLSKRRWSDLSEDEKREVIITAFQTQLSDETERRLSMKHYYDKILSEYSPQVEFKDQKMTAGELGFGMIDWGETMESVEGYNRFIDFFRTPYFSIEINGAEILIKIIDPQQVSAPLMRTIEKIYTIMKGRLGCRRKGWGENSGRRLLIRKRDEDMKRLYANWRKMTPNVGSNILIDRLCEYSKKVKIPVTSIERIKRIIYSKENKS